MSHTEIKVLTPTKNIINSFLPNAPFLSLPAEYLTDVSNVFRGLRKGALGTNRLNGQKNLTLKSQIKGEN